MSLGGLGWIGRTSLGCPPGLGGPVAGPRSPGLEFGAESTPRPLRRTIQWEIEDNLSEKILFGELRAGQIVTVDVEGTGPEAQLTFKSVPKPDEVPDTLPAVI